MNLQQALFPDFNPKTDHLTLVQIPTGYAYARWVNGHGTPITRRVLFNVETGEVKDFNPDRVSQEERFRACQVAYKRGVKTQDLALIFKVPPARMNSEVSMSPMQHFGRR